MKKKRIKILQTIRQGKIGGGETHVLDLVAALDKELFESVVLSFTEGPMVEKLKSMGIITYVIHTEKPFDFRKWKAVQEILELEKIDLIHAHGTRANSNTFFSAGKLNIPLIYTVHGWSFHPDQPLLVRKFRIWSEKFLVSKAKRTICVSESNLQDGKTLFSMDRAEVIKCGINLNKFDPFAKYENLKEDLGLSDETLLVGYLVRMTLQKDPFTLIRAIALIPERLNVRFLFVGDGDLKEESVKLSEQLGLGERIIFMDFREDIPNILNGIDLYCLPSLWEGLPLGMLEAMAMKKAVVVTAIDGAIEVINDKRNGLLIPPGQPEKLAAAIELLLLNPTLRISIGEAARETILEDFSIPKMTRAIQKVYTDLLK